MRYLFLVVVGFLFLIPRGAEAVTGQDATFRFSLGEPEIVINAEADCNDTAVARFAFVLGQPAVVYDAEANCTAAGGGEAATPPVHFYIKDGELRVKDGELRIKQ